MGVSINEVWLAVAVNVKVDSSSTDWFPIGSRTGATLMSFTVMVKVSLSTRFPVPLSVTVMVTEGVVPP